MTGKRELCDELEVPTLVDGAITVVLGPGLAPGLAALGVLAAMEERSVPIARVVGVNTGALAAALWAVESDLALAAKVLASLPWGRYLVARDLAAADPLLSVLRLLTRGQDFGQSRRRIAVVARDAESGNPVRIEDGSIALAVRGTLSVPGLFHPLEVDGRRLLDGGGVWLDAVPASERGRCLIVSHRIPERGGRELASGFSTLAMDLALFACRTWTRPPAAGERLVVSDRVGGLLDFHLAEEWYQAGRSAFERWVAGSAGDIDEGDG